MGRVEEKRKKKSTDRYPPSHIDPAAANIITMVCPSLPALAVKEQRRRMADRPKEILVLGLHGKLCDACDRPQQFLRLWL